MFFDDHKKTAQIIVGRKKANGERVSEPTEMQAETVKTEDGELDGRHEAMQDFLAAHKDNSPEGMMNALANFIDIHHSMAEEDEEPEVE